MDATARPFACTPIMDNATLRANRPEGTPRHLLHIFASFGLGGVPIRICDVMNALPGHFRHTIVALDGCFDASKRLMSHVDVAFRSLALSRYGLLSSALQIRTFIRDVSPDLLLTYNWGAIECALANRLFGLCDHVHFESGFGPEEAIVQLKRRSVFRRFVLGGARKLVVPSRTLMTIAADTWAVPPSKLVHIPNGVDLSRYCGQAGKREETVLPVSDADETIIGTVTPLRPEKNVGRLLRAFARLPNRAKCSLLIAGDGPQLASLRALAEELKIAGRTHFLGHVEDVPAILRAMDVFALSSDTEQMPNSLLQAMAAARPVAAVDVGDVRAMVSPENRRLVVARDDDGALTAALNELASDPQERADLGRSNQQHVKAHYSFEGMIAAYADLLEAS